MAQLQAVEPRRPIEKPADVALSSGDHDIPAWEDLPAQTVAATPQNRPAQAAPAQLARPDDALARHAPPEFAPPDDAADFETMHSGPEDDVYDDSGFEPVHMSDPGSSDEPEADEFVASESAEIATPVCAGQRKKARSPRLRDMSAQAWPALAASLPLTGLAAELARQSEWLGAKGDKVNLRVAVRTLAESPGKSRLRTVLSEYFGSVIELDVEYGATGDETAHAVEQAQKMLRQQEAEQAVANDPFVQALINEFGAQVVPGSISAAPRSQAA
jgi:DNA polymerase-3 subunit gamma/tau